VRAHPHLYEISTWPWLDRLSGREGRRVTLSDVPAPEWDRLQAQGFDCVYLMGVWRRSPTGRLMARTDVPLLQAYDRVLPGWSMRDVPGSPYSVQAYEPEERFGGWDGVDAARRALRERGMRLILDFVPNHTGFDHEWVRTRPELYVEGTLDNYRRAPDLFHPVDDGDRVRFIACGRDPYASPWRDVAQLHLFNPDTREALIGVLETLAAHCDGVRCDMAMLVLTDVFARTWGSTVDLLWTPPAGEFWPEAIGRVRGLTYLAEVYWDREWQLQQQGFDYTYDKRLLDRLRKGHAGDVRGHLHADADYNVRLVRFLENHDEARSALVFGERLPAAAAIACTLPGMRFFFDGQLEGAEIHSPVQLGRWAEEAARPSVQDLYQRLLRVTNEPLFHDGVWQPLDIRGAGDETYADLIASAWRLGSDHAVIVANLSSAESQGLVRLIDLPAGDAFDFVDELTDARYRWARVDLATGLYVRLARGQAHVFTIQPR
jgi:glycosidase